MYRRRRPQKNQIAFSFDSFLDVVTNVIGIIIRLIIVTWMGARAYTTAMSTTNVDAETSAESALTALPDLPVLKAEDDPASKQVSQAQRDLNQLRASLTQQLKELDLAQSRETDTLRELSLADGNRKDLDKQKKMVEALLIRAGQDVQIVALSREQLREKTRKLQAEIATVEKLPAPTKVLRFHTPVSRPVRQTDESYFECKRGKVTFIDLQGFVQDVRANVQNVIDSQPNKRKIEIVTNPIGAFRLRYFIVRDKNELADRLAGNNSRDDGLTWIVEPIVEDRGEPAEVALGPNGRFRQIVDGMDPQHSVATLWVYPDSFALFRQLRDYLHNRDIEVAGWPLMEGESIAASRYGTRSRGQ